MARRRPGEAPAVVPCPCTTALGARMYRLRLEGDVAYRARYGELCEHVMLAAMDHELRGVGSLRGAA